MWMTIKTKRPFNRRPTTNRLTDVWVWRGGSPSKQVWTGRLVPVWLVTDQWYPWVLFSWGDPPFRTDRQTWLKILPFRQTTYSGGNYSINAEILQVEDAIREMIRCTALARIVHGEGHWKVARAHATLAAGYYDLKSNLYIFSKVLPNFICSVVCNSHQIKPFLSAPLDYSVQAQYHSEIARTMMMSRVQTSSSDDDKANIMEVLCNTYYTLGRALAQLKK